MSYEQFVEIKKKVADLEKSLKDSKKSMLAITELVKTDEGKHNGRFGLEFTGHGFTQISQRLEDISGDHEHIYKDVFNIENPSESIMFPSNLKIFVLQILLAAEKAGNKWKSKKSNKGGTEYIYTMEIQKWRSGNDRCIFTCIIEENNIKTGYFDYDNKKA